MTDSDGLYAGFWRRGAAFFVDALVMGVATIALDPLVPTFAGEWARLIASTIVDLLYVATLHSSAWQATLGKRAFGIKVTDLQGRRISFWRAAWRYGAASISVLTLGIGYLMAGWTRRRQALHDKLARTLVVNAAALPTDVAAGTGVMALTGRVKAAVAALAVANIALAYATSQLPSREEADQRQPVASASPAQEERIAYEIYSMPFLAKEWRFVASGTRVYRHGDVMARQLPGTDRPYIVKSLWLADGYDIQVSVVPEPRVEGFGLTLRLDGGGFSWEWFNRESDDVFRKLQGAGRVRVRFASRGGNEEIAGVEFLDDVTLRLERYWLVPFQDRDTDHVVVRKGSVFWLAD